MKKGELVDALVAESGESASAVSRILDSFIKITTAQLVLGEEVALTGFGTFKSAVRPAREGRNPSNGEPLSIAESTVVKFSTGATLKASLNPNRK